MTLREKQSAFTLLVARLILAAQQLGYELTLGEAYRSPEEAARLAKLGKGIKASLHTQRLAIDFNLFIGGEYQTSSAAYQRLGEWWEAQSIDGCQCCWGGRFKDAKGKPKPDGNHFAISHLGRK